jgi:TonB family protein
MEPFRIYGKTELGAAALNAARGALSTSARQLLILVDGQRSVQELEGIFGAEALDRLLPQLEAQGYVHFLRHAASAPPAARPAPPAAPPARRPAPAAPAGAAQPPPRNRLAVFLLALGVLALSAALWWLFGPAHLPGATGADRVADSDARAPGTLGAPAAADPPATAAPPAVPVPPGASPTAPSVDRNAVRSRDRNRSDVRDEPRAPAGPAARSTAASTPAQTAHPGTPASAPAAAPTATAPAAVSPRAVAEPAPPTAGAPPATPATPGGGVSLSVGTPVAAPASATSGTTPGTASGAASSAASGAASSAPSAAAGAPAPPASASTPAAGAPAGTPAPLAAGAPPAVARPAAAAPVLHPRERPLPVLSRTARRAGVDSGELVVHLHVTARGTVEAVEVVRANPRQVYDPTIEQTLKKWTYDPPGVPVETNVEFVFKP